MLDDCGSCGAHDLPRVASRHCTVATLKSVRHVTRPKRFMLCLLGTGFARPLQGASFFQLFRAQNVQLRQLHAITVKLVPIDQHHSDPRPSWLLPPCPTLHSRVRRYVNDPKSSLVYCPSCKICPLLLRGLQRQNQPMRDSAYPRNETYVKQRLLAAGCKIWIDGWCACASL